MYGCHLLLHLQEDVDKEEFIALNEESVVTMHWTTDDSDSNSNTSEAGPCKMQAPALKSLALYTIPLCPCASGQVVLLLTIIPSLSLQSLVRLRTESCSLCLNSPKTPLSSYPCLLFHSTPGELAKFSPSCKPVFLGHQVYFSLPTPKVVFNFKRVFSYFAILPLLIHCPFNITLLFYFGDEITHPN